MNPDTSRRGVSGGNKLRTYRTFKTDIGCKLYLNAVQFLAQRRAYAQFWCGVTPLRIETGHFNCLHLNERTCFVCSGIIETEEHILLECMTMLDANF